jgi:hypothetical protein
MVKQEDLIAVFKQIQGNEKRYCKCCLAGEGDYKGFTFSKGVTF